MNYYVYEHLRKDNGSCIYVGKGCGDRAYIKQRNELHDRIVKDVGITIKIIKDGMNEEEAFAYEHETIMKYVFELGYGIDIEGYRGQDELHFLTNRTFGGLVECMIGENNPQFNVSPKDRMDAETYEQWLQKTKERLTNQVGAKNPNYHNDTLHKKLENNPELRKQYYSRPGGQNGRARSVILYDIDWNYIDTFSCIGDCAQWIKDNYDIKAKVDSMRYWIAQSSKTGKPYKNLHYIIEQ